MSSEENIPLVATPAKGVSTPVKSAFFTPCRRMGLKRKSTPLSAFVSSPLVSINVASPSGSPLAKKAPSVSSPCTSDSTPKRKIAPKRRSIVVTRVEKVQTEDEKCKEKKSLEVKAGQNMDNLEALVTSKREQLALLQKGVHPLQIETDRLDNLTSIWRTGCQKALEDLLEKLQKNSDEAAKVLTMQVLVSNLDIPPDLLHFDTTKEEFY